MEAEVRGERGSEADASERIGGQWSVDAAEIMAATLTLQQECQPLTYVRSSSSLSVMGATKSRSVGSPGAR
jgi:hypothetical protein